MSSDCLTIADVRLQHGGRDVIPSLSLSLAPGRIACLLGPSGCGKTTLLRAIAGFERVHGGEIRLHGECVSSAGRHVPPERRQIGMVFQDHALFPHLSVAGNVAFGLRGHRDAPARVHEVLSAVGLAALAQRYPHELSGGQQQRVALARALAPSPRLLLLDEPFANLDIELRERLGGELRQVLKAAGTTALLVTHDQHEAFAIADEIGVMSEGRLRQWASAYELYHRPADRFVADFVGQGVFLPGELRPGGRLHLELGELAVAPGALLPQGARGAAGPVPVDVLIRPDDVQHDDASPLTAEVTAKAFRGAEFLYTLRLPSGHPLLALVPSHHDHALGEAIGIRLELDHVVAFARG